MSNQKQIFLETDIHKMAKVLAAKNGLLLKQAVKNAIILYKHMIETDPQYVENIIGNGKLNNYQKA